MIAVVLGSNGQLGHSLRATKPNGVDVIALERADVDLANAAETEKLISSLSANVIINAAAYTAVDKAEAEKDIAYRVNSEGVAALARACERSGARLVHISTDYVFDGMKGAPYGPADEARPLGVYGASKRDGEIAALAACQNSLVVRTAWLYGDVGANFVRTMLRIMSGRPEVRVVYDQIGTPTYSRSLAEALWQLAGADKRGILHFTDSGVASWYDFACAIQEDAVELGLLEKSIPVIPILSSEYPTPARRPTFSILDKSETQLVLGRCASHWRDTLRTMLERLTHA